jgi:hypothetical protein
VGFNLDFCPRTLIQDFSSGSRSADEKDIFYFYYQSFKRFGDEFSGGTVRAGWVAEDIAEKVSRAIETMGIQSIDENDGGLGVRLGKRPQKKAKRLSRR